MLPTCEFGFEGETLYSPFSGLPADSTDGPNAADPTLLFVYYGDAGEYAHVSDRVLALMKIENADDLELEPEALAKRLEIGGGLVLIADAGWNGKNFYGFAPASTSAE